MAPLKPTNLLTLPALLAGALAVSGCETIGNPLDVLQGKRNAPDEFQVLARKPLRMPGNLDLPEPRLGEASPLEPDPQTDAVIALLGRPSPVSGAAGGAGEQALLDAANASARDTEIRRQLEAEEAALEDNKPYEPPTIFELLSGKSEEKHEDALNPAAEARRLQTEGVAPAPIDPDAQPPAEEGERSSDAGLFYETGDGKPKNELPSATSGQPAF